MAITPAVELADFASGIGTAPLQIDNVNDRVGVGTTAPLALLDVASFERTGLTTAVLIRHTGSTYHALRVEDEDHPDSTPFIINSNGRVAIGTDVTAGHTLSVVDVTSSVNIKSTNSNRNGEIFLSGRDNSGIAYTSKINAQANAALDIELDSDGTNTRSEDPDYRKLRIYGVGSASTLSEPGVVVAFGGTFRNGPDQVGIASVGIGTISPLGRFHIDTRNGNTVQNCFRIRETIDGGASEILKLENLYDRDIGLALRTAETDGDIDSMETRWLVWNDGALTDARQNGFRINMVGTAATTALAINTNRRIGFGTDLPDNPLHIYRNDAILACFERQGIANAGIEFRRSNSGDAARTSMFLGLSDGDTFAINNAEDLNSSPYFEINRTGIASAFAFTSSNADSNETDGTAAINLTGNTGAIAMDDRSGVLGTKRISWNDGTGNFNLRLNCTGDENYLVTGDGAAAIHLNAETTNGSVTIAAAASGTAGDSITFTEFVFDHGGKLARQGGLTIAAEGTNNDLTLDAADHIILESGTSIFFRGDNGASSYRFSKAGQTDHEGFLSFESLTADRTYTFPDAGGNVVISGTAEANTSSYFEFVNSSGVEFRGKRNDSSVVDNNMIVSMRGFSNEGGTYHDVGRVQIQGNGTHSSTSKPTSIIFMNVPSGSTTDRQVMELQQDGDLILSAVGLSGSGGSNLQRGFKMNQGGSRAEIGLHQTTDDNPLGYMLLEAEDGALRYYWTSNGNKLMINNSLPSTSGDTTTGTVVGDYSSDERLKENIVDLPYGLAEVKQLRPRRFEMKNVWDTKVYSGFVAQETQSIIPESVYSTGEDAGDGTDNKLLAMSYAELIAPLVNAVKELSTKNDELEARIATLEGS